MHGEQGALVATARLVETVPDIDSEVLRRQPGRRRSPSRRGLRALHERQARSTTYEISQPLESLLVDIMTEPRWDITYLGMQIMVEGLALAAFGLGNVLFRDDGHQADHRLRDARRGAPRRVRRAVAAGGVPQLTIGRAGRPRGVPPRGHRPDVPAVPARAGVGARGDRRRGRQGRTRRRTR